MHEEGDDGRAEEEHEWRSHCADRNRSPGRARSTAPDATPITSGSPFHSIQDASEERKPRLYTAWYAPDRSRNGIRDLAQ
jgi:hypothetical protein